MCNSRLTLTILLITVVLTLGVSISFQSLLADWAAPTVAPPDDNLGQPIDTSLSTQTKDGDLTVLGYLTIGGDALVVDSTNNLVGVGMTPVTKLDISAGGANEVGFRIIGTDRWIQSAVNLTSGAYNPISQAGDIGFIFSTDNVLAAAAGGLVIAPWSNTMSGIRIQENGNVGIGTTNPGQPLEVFTGSSALGLRINRWASGVYYSDIRQETSPEGLAFLVGDGSAITEKMRITGNGNVGIGTDNPVGALHAYGLQTSPSLNADTGIFTVHSGSTVQLVMGAQAASPYTFWMQTKKDNNIGNSYPLALNPLGGNVGIGTDIPGHKLDVTGDINFTGDLYQDGVLFSGGGSSPWQAGAEGSEIFYNADNVGIGTDNPSESLDVGSGNILTAGSFITRAGGRGLVHEDGLGTYRVYSDLDNMNGVFNLRDREPDVIPRVRLHSRGDSYFNGGNLGIGIMIPGEKLEVVGNVLATAFLYSSDERLKEDIQPIDNALNKILSLDGVSFAWKDSNELSVGLIAQDLEQVFPELVHTNPQTGLKSVQYGNLVAPLIEAIKEQQKMIETMKIEIEKLKTE